MVDRNPLRPSLPSGKKVRPKKNYSRPSSCSNDNSSPVTFASVHDGIVNSSTPTTSPALSGALPSSPSNSVPPPPPGFQKASIFGLEENKVDRNHENDLKIHEIFDAANVNSRKQNDWKADLTAASSPQRVGVVPEFFPSASFARCVGTSEGGTITIQENPFSSNTVNISHQDNTDSQIEAELQELGGQMAGSILDF